jgi:hypothetical protein
MRLLQRFWQSFEMLNGTATLPAEWQRLMGADYLLVQRFFRPAGDLATWFPHPDPNQIFYRVVTHGPDDHVGICDETGERVVLATADLVIQELDRPALQRALAAALGVVYDADVIASLPITSRIGHYVPLAGYSFPTFLTIQSHPVDFGRVVDRLVAVEEGPFLLLAPSRRFLRPICEDLLRRRRACFLPLDESIGLGEDGGLTATDAAGRMLDGFRQHVVPARAAEPGVVFFPTPSGATWSQVRLHLVDGHTASVTAGAARGVYNYAQMGMANCKSGGPSVQWELLRAFAACGGTLTWRSPQADRRNQKRREKLARSLKEFFHLDDAPFLAYGNGWRTRFAITEAK